MLKACFSVIFPNTKLPCKFCPLNADFLKPFIRDFWISKIFVDRKIFESFYIFLRFWHFRQPNSQRDTDVSIIKSDSFGSK